MQKIELVEWPDPHECTSLEMTERDPTPVSAVKAAMHVVTKHISLIRWNPDLPQPESTAASMLILDFRYPEKTS